MQKGGGMPVARWVIFDMDGTLTDSMAVWDEVPARLLARFGKTPAPDLRRRLLPLGMEQTARLMIAEYALPVTGAEFAALAAACVREGYRQVGLCPGAAQLVRALAGQGARLCVASATPEPLCREVLARLGLLPYFEFVASGQKDTPALYLACMERLGAPCPAQTVVFEDAPHAVRTAKAAGFYTVAVAEPHAAADTPQLRALADRYLLSLAEYLPGVQA